MKKIEFNEAKEGDWLVNGDGSVRVRVAGTCRGENGLIATDRACTTLSSWQALGFHVEREEPAWVGCSGAEAGIAKLRGQRAQSDVGGTGWADMDDSWELGRLLRTTVSRFRIQQPLEGVSVKRLRFETTGHGWLKHKEGGSIISASAVGDMGLKEGDVCVVTLRKL